MSSTLKELSSRLEKLKEECKIPDIDACRQKALEEVGSYADESDKKIATIMVENIFREIEGNFTELNRFFSSQPTKPTALIDDTTNKINHSIELLEHQYKPFVPPATVEPSEKITETKAEKVEEAKNRRPYYPIRKDVYKVIDKFGNEEVFAIHQILQDLPEQAKEHYKGKQKKLETHIWAALNKGIEDEKIEKIERGKYRKLVKPKRQKAPIDEGVKIVERFFQGKEFSTLSVYEGLSTETKARYPEGKQRTNTFLFNVMTKAKEDGLVRDIGYTRNHVNRKLYRRI